MASFQFVSLFFVAILAGLINSVAGGGSFFTVPTMIFSGILPVLANTTSTVALWPGTAASLSAYRRDLCQIHFKLIFLLVSTSLLGGILGAFLLLHTSQELFMLLLPYLLLLATLIFTFSGVISKKFQSRDTQAHLSLFTMIVVIITQFMIAIYGGYFGGGAGILMLATLAMMGMTNIHSMNALKALLGASTNGIAVVLFIVAHAVIWPEALLMIVGAIIGGYSGASFARKIEQKWIRGFVIIAGFTMTIFFFVRH